MTQAEGTWPNQNHLLAVLSLATLCCLPLNPEEALFYGIVNAVLYVSSNIHPSKPDRNGSP